MINTLFSMHNIKYIISVDDCFFARKREDIEATIYSEMGTSLEPFRAILSSCNQTEIVDAIDEMMTVGADSTTLIQYGIALSRIGHPFDFSGEISAFE